MCHDDHPVGRVLTRREVLAFLGASGAAMLASCSFGDSDSATGTASDTSSGTASSTATAVDSAASAPSEQSDPTSTIAETPAASQTDSASDATVEQTESTVVVTATDELATVIPTCIVSPELTEGPYFVDEGLNRSDIRPDPSTGAVAEGVLLDLVLRVYQVSADGCVALEGAVVDVWHCDAFGVYSDVSDPGFNTSGQQFLRGYQVTDDAGTVRFTTVYPGWYQGHAVHIHFKIRGDAGSAQSFEFTSQFFCNEEVTDEVHALEPYASKGYRTLLNEGDMIFQQGGSQLIINPEQTDDGYTGTFDVGLML